MKAYSLTSKENKLLPMGRACPNPVLVNLGGACVSVDHNTVAPADCVRGIRLFSQKDSNSSRASHCTFVQVSAAIP